MDIETRVSCILFDGISIAGEEKEREMEEGSVERRLA